MQQAHALAECDPPRIVTLDRGRENTLAALRSTIHTLERTAEDQRLMVEEALSANATLTALNGQLQAALQRARTTSDDLQNVLYSMQEATLFLDPQLLLRFFTPATRAVFCVLPGDIGRPLADLRTLATDTALLGDAAAVLAGATPRMQEIMTADGAWFLRRVLPYRAQDATVAGVVITFVDITARRATKEALRQAMQRAEQASAAKSRYLGAASHDLRQPLQTLMLQRDLLAKIVEGEQARQLVAMQEPTLAAMSGMLDMLHDSNQIDIGIPQADPVIVPIDPVQCRWQEETGDVAPGQRRGHRLVPHGLGIRSDPLPPTDAAWVMPTHDSTTIHVVEDGAQARNLLLRVLERDGQAVIGHTSAEAFLEAYRPGGEACLLLDAQLPGMSGFDLLERLRQAGDLLPTIMVTGFSDVGAAVRAMKSGASDFIEKPVLTATLRAALDRALAQSLNLCTLAAWRQKATARLTSLTARQREVMARVLAGDPSKNIAADLGISQRTVETHRAEIMRRTGARSLPALARLALAAEAGSA